MSSSSNRRSTKPLMEKRRRARINSCLDELKILVLHALQKDPAQYTKLEKADILEMTVQHLKTVQRQQMAVAMATDPNVMSRYRAGFNECAAEISRYLESVHSSRPELRSRVLNHLAGCINRVPFTPTNQCYDHGLDSGLSVHLQIPQTSFHPAVIRDAFTGTKHEIPTNDSSYFDKSAHSQYRLPRVPPKMPGSAHMSSYVSLQNDKGFSTPMSSKHRDHHLFSPESLLSPINRIPSPCGSDSGLSDVSAASFSKDDVSYLNRTDVSYQDDSLFNNRQGTRSALDYNFFSMGSSVNDYHMTDDSTLSSSSDSESSEIGDNSGQVWRPW